MVVCAVRVFVFVCTDTYRYVGVLAYVSLLPGIRYRVRVCLLVYIVRMLHVCIVSCANVHGVCFGFRLCSTQALYSFVRFRGLGRRCEQA